MELIVSSKHSSIRDHNTASTTTGHTYARLMWARVVVSLPDRLLLIFLCTLLVVGCTLVSRAFHPWLVLPLIVALVAATWRLAPVVEQVDVQKVMGSLAALVFIVVWIVLNRPYHSQLISVWQDPAIYTLRAHWLVNHASPVIPVGSVSDAVEGLPSVTAYAGGFPTIGHTIYPQGTSLVPGLLALGGWITPSVVSLGNLVLGGLGLLSIYAFGRRMLGPLWALVPVAALAASVPMTYFSRSNFTEPTQLACTFGGLTFLWFGLRRGRISDYIVAGLFIGAGSIARIDGTVAVIGAVAALTLYTIAAADQTVRIRRRWALGAFAISAVITTLIGWLDLHRNSPVYLSALNAQLRPLLTVFAAVCALAVIVIFMPQLRRLTTFLLARARVISIIGLSIAVLVAVAMFIRPLWWTGRFNTGPVGRSALAVRQTNLHMQVDPSRSYDEQSLKWLSWYYSWPIVVLCAIGGALIVYAIVRQRDIGLLVFALVGSVVAALYLNNVSITPIQVWATRRFLPVIIPAMLIAGVWALVQLWRWRGLRPLLLASAAFMALVPLASWGTLANNPEMDGQRSEEAAFCSAISASDVNNTKKVVVAGAVPSTGFWEPVSRVICGASTVGMTSPTTQALAQLRATWGDEDIALVVFNPAGIEWVSPPSGPWYQATITIWPEPILSRPRTPIVFGEAIWAGTVGADGRVTPAHH